jgi:hypothetical protein
MKGLLDLKLTDCRWVLDEPGPDGLALFCGARVLRRHGKLTSYCPDHAAICYRGTERARPRVEPMAA